MENLRKGMNDPVLAYRDEAFLDTEEPRPIRTQNTVMINELSQKRFEIGMVGLGVMGGNFALNMADHGVAVAGYDKDLAKVSALQVEAEKRDIHGATDIQEFIALQQPPRAIAETYDLMKRGLGMDDDEIGETYASWNKGELNS